MLGLIVAAPRSLPITLRYRARAIASFLGEDCYGNFDTIGISDDLYWRTESVQDDLQANRAGNERSSRGTNRVIAGSQHSIPLDRPAALVSAVNDVVDEDRYHAHR